MAGLDERVAYLEGRMEDHTALMADLRADIRGLRSDIRSEMTELRSDIRRVDQKIDRHFMWLVGILVGVVLGLVGLALQVARLQAA
ncbi:MAG TPA: hypothetical protein VIK60_18535 [Vicinamibacterales bacterium]